MSDLDREIIQRCRRRFKREPEPVDPRLAAQNRRLRKEAVGRFIMTLSDQQLVTGLAIMTSSVSIPGKITGYEFSMTCGLALLAFTTHVATLSAVRPDFKSNDLVSNIRITAMTATVLLLVYALIINLIAWFPIPVQCAFEGEFYHPDPLTLAANIVFFLLILRIYYTPVQRIYFSHRTSVYAAHWFCTRVGRPWRRPNGVTVNSRRTLVDEYEPWQCREELRVIQGARSWRKRWLLSGIFRYRSDGSFLQRLPDIVFSFWTGLSLIIYTRSDTSVELNDDASEMGFGQMMALLLLGLQLLGAAEAYRSMSPSIVPQLSIPTKAFLTVGAGYRTAQSRLQRSPTALPEMAGQDRIPLLEAGEYGVQPGIVRAFAAVAPALIMPEDPYEEQFARVLKYFRREVRELASLSQSATSTEDIKSIEQRKSSVATQTDQFEMTISQMGMSAPISIFVFDVVWTATLGILTSLDVWYGSILMLVLFGLLVMGDLQQLITLISPSLQRSVIT